jgi:hypothetical protein
MFSGHKVDNNLKKWWANSTSRDTLVLDMPKKSDETILELTFNRSKTV